MPNTNNPIKIIAKFHNVLFLSILTKRLINHAPSIVKATSTIAILKTLIENHCQYTKSNIAEKILNQWDAELENFVKVMPIEYKRALNEMKETKKKEVA